jgi:uncharacterized protein YfeS
MTYNIKKPYKWKMDVTYDMITTHPYFRTLTKKELYEVVDWMENAGYKKLKGVEIEDKVDNLYNSFKKEHSMKQPFTVEGSAS